MQEITTKALHEKIANNEPITIIDVREENVYQQGTIDTAQNIPLPKLKEHLGALQQCQTLYISCGGGTRSKKACAFLAEHNIPAINVKGGYRSWKAHS